MKKLQVYLIIVLCVFFISCDKPKNSTKELEEVFTVEEIKDLNILVDFFEDRLRNHGKDLPTAYKKLMLRRANFEKKDSYLNSFKRQDLEVVFGKIDSNTFNEIWGKSIMRSNRILDSVIRNSPLESGKYIKFLKRIEPKYPKVKEYLQSILFSDADYSGAKYMFVRFDFRKERAPKFHVTANFRDFYVRLIITISELDYLDNHYRTKEFMEKLKND